MFDDGATWYYDLGTHGEELVTGDFNGDGRTDVAELARGGTAGTPAGHVRVALSTGTSFAAATLWDDDFAPGGEVVRVGDANGDGRDDLIAFARNALGWDARGEVYVALSTGTGFGPETEWHDYFCIGDETPVVGDFNGDGRDDIATLVGDTKDPPGINDVYVALSTGASFGESEQWHDWFGTNGELVRVGDFDGDGRDDMAAFVRSSRPGGQEGDVWVTRSTGTSFSATSLWNAYLCIDGELPEVGDFNGDGKADVVTFIHDTKPNDRAAVVNLSTGQSSPPWPCGRRTSAPRTRCRSRRRRRRRACRRPELPGGEWQRGHRRRCQGGRHLGVAWKRHTARILRQRLRHGAVRHPPSVRPVHRHQWCAPRRHDGEGSCHQRAAHALVAADPGQPQRVRRRHDPCSRQGGHRLCGLCDRGQDWVTTSMWRSSPPTRTAAGWWVTSWLRRCASTTSSTPSRRACPCRTGSSAPWCTSPGSSSCSATRRYGWEACRAHPGRRSSGTYDMVHDNWEGTLTLAAAEGDPVEGVGNVGGTYTGTDGVTHAVQGFVRAFNYPLVPSWGPDHQIVFYIDFPDTLTTSDDQRFAGYLFTHGGEGIAGSTLWNGTPFGFYAVKQSAGGAPALASFPVSDPIAKADFTGAWVVEADGWPATLVLEELDDDPGGLLPNLTGTLTFEEGASHAVRGWVRTPSYPLPISVPITPCSSPWTSPTRLLTRATTGGSSSTCSRGNATPSPAP